MKETRTVFSLLRARYKFSHQINNNFPEFNFFKFVSPIAKHPLRK